MRGMTTNKLGRIIYPKNIFLNYLVYIRNHIIEPLNQERRLIGWMKT